MAIEVVIEHPSVESGERPYFAIRGPELHEGQTVGIEIVEIEADQTEFKASWGRRCQESGADLRVEVPDSIDLGVGLYAIARISLAAASTDGNCRAGCQVTFTEEDFGLQLFEIRKASDAPASAEELQARLQGTMRGREEELAAGVGLDSSLPGVDEYFVLIFVKDCLLTRVMQLGPYEITPFDGLGTSDEAAVIQEFLHAATADSIPAEMASAIGDKGKRDHPCFVARFPVVRAQSHSDAAKLADEEVRVLCGVLSLQRQAYPSPFGAFVKNSRTNKCRVWTLGRDYTGNLIGGLISGEDSRAIRRGVEQAKGDEGLRLFLGLHRDALEETDPEVAYYRLWSLLEAMARRRVRRGEPKLGWSGRPILSVKRMKPLTVRGSDEFVFEYLRRVIGPMRVNFNYSSEVDQSTWEELVAIWYRRRNCIAHLGGCRPEDATQCLRSEKKYANCKAAIDEMSRKHGKSGIDSYRRVLRDVARTCVAHEVWAGAPRRAQHP